jgi:hypothetical protein
MELEDKPQNRQLNVGDSIGLGSLIVAILLVIVTLPLWLKAVLLILSSAGCFVFAHKSHWTHSWSAFWKSGSASIVVICLGLLGVPQLVTSVENRAS